MWLDPDLVPDLVKSLCLKDYICTTNPIYHLAKISKFQCAYSQFTYQVSGTIRILSTLRSHFEKRLSRGDLGMQSAAMQDCSMGLGLSTIYGVR